MACRVIDAMTRTQCRDQSKSRVSDVSEGNWKHRKYHAELTSPRSLVWDFLQWSARREKFPGHLSKLAAFTLPSLALRGPKTHLANVASPQETLLGHYSNIFVLPKTAKTETKERRFARSLLVQ